MVVWLHYLPGAGISFEESFDDRCGLIVGDVEDWLVTLFGEVVEYSSEGSDDVFIRSGLDW